MHPEALAFVGRNIPAGVATVLDIGGRDVNGTPRVLFGPDVTYVALDVHRGPGVDVVADATTWAPDRAYDLVVCCEVFEHIPAWREVLVTAYRALAPGGRLVVTCAGPGRPPHSGWDGAELRPGEWYRNLTAAELADALTAAGFTGVSTDELPEAHDLRATAERPKEVAKRGARRDVRDPKRPEGVPVDHE